MAKYSQNILMRLGNLCRYGASNSEKGRALEDLICYLINKVPGTVFYERDSLNHFESEEIDVAFWNSKHKKGFYFLDQILLVECKNWSGPVGSEEVAWFDRKLVNRNQSYGVLVVANGITGDPDDLKSAHNIITLSLAAGRRLLIFSLDELLQVRNTEELVHKFTMKLCELAVKGTIAL